jgi:CHAD domain-containing protein
MSFEIDSHQDVRKQVRKTASRQLDKALKTIRGGASARSRDGVVHHTRRRLKEVRALLRLVRGDLGEKTFSRDNRALRNAARPLSEVRDATALIEALKKLQEHYAKEVRNKAFESMRKALRARRVAIRRKILDKDRALQNSAATILKVRGRIDQWDLQHGAWKALQSGLFDAYDKGRQAMLTATKDPSDENFHEWRKRAKDLRYQLELLKPLWPETMTIAGEQAHELTDLLGDDHDLAVLAELAENEFKDVLAPDVVETLQALITRRRGDLQESARLLSEKLFAEPPGRFVGRIKTYWKSAASGPRVIAAKSA